MTRSAGRRCEDENNNEDNKDMSEKMCGRHHAPRFVPLSRRTVVCPSPGHGCARLKERARAEEKLALENPEFTNDHHVLADI
jgi:hypothetical protein